VLCATASVKIVKALYDFQPLQKDDLAFSKGDKMKIILSDNASVHALILLLALLAVAVIAVFAHLMSAHHNY